MLHLEHISPLWALMQQALSVCYFRLVECVFSFFQARSNALELMERPASPLLSSPLNCTQRVISSSFLQPSGHVLAREDIKAPDDCFDIDVVLFFNPCDMTGNQIIPGPTIINCKRLDGLLFWCAEHAFHIFPYFSAAAVGGIFSSSSPCLGFVVTWIYDELSHS